jgi:hypothetical protein
MRQEAKWGAGGMTITMEPPLATGVELLEFLAGRLLRYEKRVAHTGTTLDIAL